MPEKTTMTPVLKGFIRKRPHWKGSWKSRFFTLTEEDFAIRVFNSEEESVTYFAKGKAAEAQPKYVVTIYSDLLCSEPFQKSVRTDRISSKKESLWVVQVYREGKQGVEVLLTIGEATKETMDKWKSEIIRLVAKAPGPPNVPQDKPSTISMRKASRLAIPELWQDDENWNIIEAGEEEVKIEGEKEFLKEFPMLRAKATVPASSDEVFQMVMDDSKRKLWDDSVQENKVLRKVSDSCDIVYMQLRPIWIGPMYTSPRDLVLLRYWRKDEDHSYVVNWQSVEDPDISPIKEGFVRGKIFAMSFSVTPETANSSVVRISIHSDPGPPLSFLPSAMIQRWMLPFVTRLVGLKKALQNPNARINIVDKDGDMMGGGSDRNIASLRVESSQDLETNSLKLGSMDHASWTFTPKEETYNIRGKTYLTDGVKYKNGGSMFHLVAVDLYKLKEPTPHAAARSDSPMKKIFEAYPDRQAVVIQFMLPGPPFYSLCFYGVAKKHALENPDAPFARLWNDFKEGSDEYRNSCFKMIPRVTQGAYVVRRTVGETPALLGKKMKMVYYVASNYVECDCDLGTSAVAGSILSIVKGYATTLTVDLGVLLEGHSIDELPEEMMVCLRLTKANLGKAKELGPDPDPETTRKNREKVEKKGETLMKDGGEEE